MKQLGDYLIPAIVVFIIGFGVFKKVPVFDVFIEGAREGITTCIKILPSLIALMTAVAMFSASGALDAVCHLLTPVAHALGLPEQCMPLALLRPVSGSGSLALFEGVVSTGGVDSFAGRVAAVMQGSSETTFYAIAVYYGSVGIKDTRSTLSAALLGDFTCFVMSAVAVRLFMG